MHGLRVPCAHAGRRRQYVLGGGVLAIPIATVCWQRGEEGSVSAMVLHGAVAGSEAMGLVCVGV